MHAFLLATLLPVMTFKVISTPQLSITPIAPEYIIIAHTRLHFTQRQTTHEYVYLHNALDLEAMTLVLYRDLILRPKTLPHRICGWQLATCTYWRIGNHSQQSFLTVVAEMNYCLNSLSPVGFWAHYDIHLFTDSLTVSDARIKEVIKSWKRCVIDMITRNH